MKTIKDPEKIKLKIEINEKNEIKFFKNHHLVKVKLDEKRAAFKFTKSLSIPVATRWLSLCTSTNNLQALKYVLIQLVNEETELIKSFNPRQTSAAVLRLINSTKFWIRLGNLIKEIEFTANVSGKIGI